MATHAVCAAFPDHMVWMSNSSVRRVQRAVSRACWTLPLPCGRQNVSRRVLSCDFVYMWYPVLWVGFRGVCVVGRPVVLMWVHAVAGRLVALTHRMWVPWRGCRLLPAECGVWALLVDVPVRSAQLDRTHMRSIHAPCWLCCGWWCLCLTCPPPVVLRPKPLRVWCAAG